MRVECLHWGDATERHVRTIVVVGPLPARGNVLNLVDAVEQVAGKPSEARPLVAKLYVGVLLDYQVDVEPCDAVVVSACLQENADLLRPTVEVYRCRLSTPLGDLFQPAGQPLPWR